MRRRCTIMVPPRILIAVVSAVIVLAPTAASAAELHARVVGSVPAGVAITTDGRRFLATPNGSGVTVRDVTTGTRRTITAPAGCWWTGTVRVATALFGCSAFDASASRTLSDGYVVDLGDGATHHLPTLLGTVYDDGTSYVDVGTRWAMAYRYGYHARAAVYVDRATGAQIEAPPYAADHRVDLDAPQLSVPLCAPVQRPFQINASGLGLAPGDMVVDGRWTAGNYAADGPHGISETVQLQRCGHGPVVLEFCADAPCPVPQLDDRMVVWLDHAYPTSRSATLHVRSLRTGRTRTLVVRISGNRGARVALVAHRIYVQAGSKLLRVRP